LRTNRVNPIENLRGSRRLHLSNDLRLFSRFSLPEKRFEPAIAPALTQPSWTTLWMK
jgi:hypothetical protein